jgi:hypothetical protein
MSEKRFKIADYPTDIEDTVTGEKYPCSSYGTHMEIICDLLNELHNKYIDEYTLRETLQLELQRVEEENKELKKQVNDLQFNKSIGQREYQRRLSE